LICRGEIQIAHGNLCFFQPKIFIFLVLFHAEFKLKRVDVDRATWPGFNTLLALKVAPVQSGFGAKPPAS
jgi:hypothetical protein